ncbi:MAG TPA: FAD-binding protein, partial [Candidatus Paceibacterota bacterium]|nr:FAD-binding protein [Candidatus Paceibacterota bacterium]
MSLAEDIKAAGVPDAEDAPEVMSAFRRDASIFEMTPAAVVYARGAGDIGNLVRFASGRRGVSLTPRGGGSDMTGGSITDSVLIDLTRHMNRIHEVTGTRA